MKKTNSENIMGGNKMKEDESDTGNIVGVAEVSVQRDVLIGRSIMKFKDLRKRIATSVVGVCAWTRSIGKWASRRSY